MQGSTRSLTPLAALGAGLVGGALGSAAQNLFFRVTAKIAPETSRDVFEPPEEAQRSEQALETVARRLVEQMMQRGPLSADAKRRGAELVHYGFGAMWGGLYGLTRETFPVVATLPGTLGFGVLVWAISDNVILPAFKLSAWPGAYPVEVHAYAIAAHLAYAAGLGFGYGALAARPWLSISGMKGRRGAMRRVITGECPTG